MEHNTLAEIQRTCNLVFENKQSQSIGGFNAFLERVKEHVDPSTLKDIPVPSKHFAIYSDGEYYVTQRLAEDMLDGTVWFSLYRLRK